MKTIFEEMGGTYRQVGYYFIPNITLPDDGEYQMILSRLVDTFFSRISPTMQLPPKHHSIAYVLPWAEGLHWQSRSSGCSNS